MLKVKVWQLGNGEYEIGLFSKIGMHTLRSADTHVLAHCVAEEMVSRIQAQIICEAPECVLS